MVGNYYSLGGEMSLPLKKNTSITGGMTGQSVENVKL